MGALSLRFKHKDLLLTGLLLLGVSAVLCGFAPDFITMLVSYSVSGLGSAMITPMALTLAGTYFSQEARAGAISWIVSGQALAYLVGTPIIGYLAGIGGWRWAFFGFVLPLSILSLVIAYLKLPTEANEPKQPLSLKNISAGFRGIFSKTSANACIIGNVLSMACWTAVLLYSASFNRQNFGASITVASLLLLGGSACYTAGSFLSGRLVKRFGLKPLTVYCAVAAGVFTILFTYMPYLWLSSVCAYLGCFFSGARVSAANSLAIEQVPGLSGTMMSFNLAASYLGQSLGGGLGGLVLIVYGYSGMSFGLGILGVVAGLVYFFKAIDPTLAPRETRQIFSGNIVAQ